MFTEEIATQERNTIKDFNKLDEDSFCFRYSTDTKGNDTLNGIDYISLNNFQSQISIVIMHIDNIKETLAHAGEC